MPLTILHPSTIQHTWVKDYDPLTARDALFGFEFPFSDWPYREWYVQPHPQFPKQRSVALLDTWSGPKRFVVPYYAPLQEWWCAVMDWFYSAKRKEFTTHYGKRSESMDTHNPLHWLFTIHGQVGGALQCSHTGGLYSVDRYVEFDVYMRSLQYYLEQEHPHGIEFKFEDYRLTKGDRGQDWFPDAAFKAEPTPANTERAQKYWRTKSPWRDLVNHILETT